MDWFARTHEIEAIGSITTWRRRELPAAGGLGDQDAKLIAALDYARRVANELLRQAAAPDAEAELRAFHSQRPQ